MEVGGDVLLSVGYDNVEDKSYLILNGLSPMAGGELEHIFCLLEVNHAAHTEHRYWSGRDVAQLISRDDRAKLLECLLFGVRLLIMAQKPTRVYHCTHDLDLPEKALRKHILITGVFKDCGYIIQEEPPRLGNRAWWMEHPADEVR